MNVRSGRRADFAVVTTVHRNGNQKSSLGLLRREAKSLRPALEEKKQRVLLLPIPFLGAAG
jgi:hypothetical protein